MTTEVFRAQVPFAKLLGVELIEVSQTRVEATIEVQERLCTVGNIMHGGALMSFADCLGALGSFYNLPEGKTATTTIESKTNFLNSAQIGLKLTGVSTPLKLGGKLSVWQTSITRPDGETVAAITQTQFYL